MDISRQLANEALSNYNFGSGVKVEDVNGWESNSRDTEMICSVFLKFETDESEDETHLGKFTVDFKNGKISYANCSCEGELIGTPVWEF